MLLQQNEARERQTPEGSDGRAREIPRDRDAAVRMGPGVAL